MSEEKRQLQEQIASHTYRRSATPQPALRHKVADTATPSRPETIRQRQVQQLDHVRPAAAEQFVHRRNQLYSARATPSSQHTRMKPRTLAQTGVPASNGQMRAIHPVRPMAQGRQQRQGSSVPMRSGRLQGRRSGFLWKVLGIFALLLVIVLPTYFALTSNAFRISQVSVVGTHNDVLVQNIQHMGMRGQNIFMIDVVALTTRIDALPMVATASLEKQWPNQLLVNVTERRPVLLWKTAQGTFSVDKNGIVIAPASATTVAASLITVVDMRNSGKGVTTQAIHSGIQLNQADITFAMAVFANLPKLAGVTDYTLRYVNTAPAHQIGGQGTAEDTGSYVVASTAGWLANLGGPNDANPLSNRLLELQQILVFAQQQQLNLATIDLRFGLRPVYTVKS